MIILLCEGVLHLQFMFRMKLCVIKAIKIFSVHSTLSLNNKYLYQFTSLNSASLFKLWIWHFHWLVDSLIFIRQHSQLCDHDCCSKVTFITTNLYQCDVIANYTWMECLKHNKPLNASKCEMIKRFASNWRRLPHREKFQTMFTSS